MTNVVRANRTLADRAQFGLGTDTQDDQTVPATDETNLGVEDVVESKVDLFSSNLATHAAADFSTSVHGLPKMSVVAGEDETATHQITVTGMAAGDTVVGVLVFVTAASIATMTAHAGTLTAAAGKITPGTEVNNTGNQYVVFWIDNA